ncbi:hypothetical protein HDV03_002779 [Kappamyces sp. JEL0829]|nr:hypothetical protein HDV03_002779 [Kappamyces sp. JEL0829]
MASDFAIETLQDNDIQWELLSSDNETLDESLVIVHPKPVPAAISDVDATSTELHPSASARDIFTSLKESYQDILVVAFLLMVVAIMCVVSFSLLYAFYIVVRLFFGSVYSAVSSLCGAVWSSSIAQPKTLPPVPERSPPSFQGLVQEKLYSSLPGSSDIEKMSLEVGRFTQRAAASLSEALVESLSQISQQCHTLYTTSTPYFNKTNLSIFLNQIPATVTSLLKIGALKASLQAPLSTVSDVVYASFFRVSDFAHSVFASSSASLHRHIREWSDRWSRLHRNDDPCLDYGAAAWFPATRKLLYSLCSYFQLAPKKPAETHTWLSFIYPSRAPKPSCSWFCRLKKLME